MVRGSGTLPIQDSSLKHVVCPLSPNEAQMKGWMDEEGREQGMGDHKVSSKPRGRDHLELRWDMILLSCQDDFLLRMALNSRNIPFGQNTRKKFMHAIQSFFANFLLTSRHMGAI